MNFSANYLITFCRCSATKDKKQTEKNQKTTTITIITTEKAKQEQKPNKHNKDLGKNVKNESSNGTETCKNIYLRWFC